MPDRKNIVKTTNSDFIEDQSELSEQSQISESAELEEAQQEKERAQQIKFRISHSSEDSHIMSCDNEVLNNENDKIVNLNQDENDDRAAGASTGDESISENDEISKKESDSENDENAAQQSLSSTTRFRQMIRSTEDLEESQITDQFYEDNSDYQSEKPVRGRDSQ